MIHAIQSLIFYRMSTKIATNHVLQKQTCGRKIIVDFDTYSLRPSERSVKRSHEVKI